MKTTASRDSSVKLSVIIPAYKAEKFIAKNLETIHAILSGIRYKSEIICVVDGNLDKTYERALMAAKKLSNTKVVGYQNNLGKGYAVRYGMARAKGDIIGFIDAGIDLNPNGLAMLLEHFEWYGADIIIGSKRHPASKVLYPWQRRILSFGYQMFVRLIFGLNIKDTQVGMKFFRREVIEKTLPRLLVKRWAFDIEMLAVANYLGYTRIYEAPIELDMKFDGTSTLMNKKIFKVILGMMWDTAAVFYRLRILRFYDDKNHRMWIVPEYFKL